MKHNEHYLFLSETCFPFNKISSFPNAQTWHAHTEGRSTGFPSGVGDDTPSHSNHLPSFNLIAYTLFLSMSHQTIFFKKRNKIYFFLSPHFSHS